MLFSTNGKINLVIETFRLYRDISLNKHEQVRVHVENLLVPKE
jgi:hypothetical protein